MDTSTSPADAADEVFGRILQEGKIFSHVDPDLSEADTRCKLIDPLFKDVLNWQEADIRREPPAADGFADYLFGAEFPYFHVEAKRSLPRFSVNVPSRARHLKLKGPHLLGNKDVRPLLEQTAKYAFDLGTEFAILTNGSQLILFKTRLYGKSWKEGSAYVWHDHDDIKKNFEFFYNLLSRQAVCAGSLIEQFQTLHKGTVQSFTPSQFISNPDREFVRNRLWGQISLAFGPLLVVQPDDPEIQKEIVTNCYVNTPLSDQADRNINELLRDRMPKFLRDSNVSELTGAEIDESKFRTRILEDMKVNKAKTYILTGGVGSGKTTFLRRFAIISQPTYLKNFGVWIHIDYLPIGNIEEAQIDTQGERIKSFTIIARPLIWSSVQRLEFSGVYPFSGGTHGCYYDRGLDQEALSHFEGSAC